jgi:hypothetical protein
MYRGGPNWAYINAKQEASIYESEAFSASHKLNSLRNEYRNWFVDEKEIIDLLRGELIKEKPSLPDIKKIFNQMVVHYQKGVNLTHTT